MKFSDFASCYGLSSPKATQLPEGDTTVLDTTRTVQARRANRSSAGSSAGSRPWRPVLDVIMENPTAAPFPAPKHDRGQVNCRSDKPADKAKAVTHKSRYPSCHDGGYSRKNSTAVMLSAFYPSPLMF